MASIAKYYKVLGIEPGASLREIKEAYRDLASVWHPDRFPNNSRLQEKAQEKLKEINLAYEYLRSHYASEQPKLTEIIIDPQLALLNIGESQILRLIGLDENRNPVNLNCTNWSTTGGTISSEGLFLAEQEGCFIVTASARELTASIQISVINSSSQEIDDHIENESDKRKNEFSSQSGLTDGYQREKRSKNSRTAFFIRLIVWSVWALLLFSSNPDRTQSLISVFHIPFFGFCFSCFVAGTIHPSLVIVLGFKRSQKTVMLVYLLPILIAVFCPFFPFYWIPFTIIETSVWVAVDSRRIGVKKGQLGGGFFDRGRWGWFFLCLLIWVMGFPSYLVKRGEYLRRNKQAKASPS